ncbi:MAG TPA: DUF167 domain-containing protein [Ktedonobacteraceae bacterium]|jgi:hypothetical protein
MRIDVHVVPRSNRNALIREGESLKVWLTAAPVDGAANEALIRLLARQLDLPRSALRVVRGASGRRKVVEIDGMTMAQMVSKLA